MSNTKPKQKKSLGSYLKSRTVWAGILGAVGQAFAATHPQVTTVCNGLAMVLGAVGVRGAIAANGNGQ